MTREHGPYVPMKMKPSPELIAQNKAAQEEIALADKRRKVLNFTYGAAAVSVAGAVAGIPAVTWAAAGAAAEGTSRLVKKQAQVTYGGGGILLAAFAAYVVEFTTDVSLPTLLRDNLFLVYVLPVYVGSVTDWGSDTKDASFAPLKKSMKNFIACSAIGAACLLGVGVGAELVKDFAATSTIHSAIDHHAETCPPVGSTTQIGAWNGEKLNITLARAGYTQDQITTKTIAANNDRAEIKKALLLQAELTTETNITGVKTSFLTGNQQPYRKNITRTTTVANCEP